MATKNREIGGLMGGRGSGGGNRRTLAQLRLSGGYRLHRHAKLLQPAASAENSVPADTVSRAPSGLSVRARRLWQALSPRRSPAELVSLEIYVRGVDDLVQLRGQRRRERDKAVQARLARHQRQVERLVMDISRQLNLNGYHAAIPMAPTQSSASSNGDVHAGEVEWYTSGRFGDDDENFSPHDAIRLRRTWRRDPAAEIRWCQERGIEPRKKSEAS